MPRGQLSRRRPDPELAYAAAFRAARIEAGRTQAEVAERADLPLKMVQRIAQGARRMTLAEAAAIAAGIGVSLDDIVTAARAATFAEAAMGRPRAHRA